MISYLIKNPDGTYKKCDKDEKPTHVYMPKYEYEDMAEDSISTLHLRNDITTYTMDAFQFIDDRSAAEKKLKRAKKKISDLPLKAFELADIVERKEKELEDLIRGNENLLRMIREKANAVRNLRPKKQHIGYVPVRAEQYKANAGYDENTGPIYATIWKTTFETPYPVLIFIDDIKDVILCDLSEKVLGECGTVFYNCDLADIPDEYSKDNVVYYYDFHYNGKDKSGLWNICLYSTQQIDLSRIKTLI